MHSIFVEIKFLTALKGLTMLIRLLCVKKKIAKNIKVNIAKIVILWYLS